MQDINRIKDVFQTYGFNIHEYDSESFFAKKGNKKNLIFLLKKFPSTSQAEELKKIADKTESKLTIIGDFSSPLPENLRSISYHKLSLLEKKCTGKN